jgi:transposase
MLSLSHCQRIFLSRSPVDMRKGRNGLAALVEQHLGQDPLSGDAFVFIGCGAQMVKVLMWDVSGYWLAQKRLESGRFAVRGRVGARGTPGAQMLSVAELMAILEGIDVRQAAYHQHYSVPATCVTNRKGSYNSQGHESSATPIPEPEGSL